MSKLACVISRCCCPGDGDFVWGFHLRRSMPGLKVDPLKELEWEKREGEPDKQSGERGYGLSRLAGD